jgi:hypothetical protein
MLFIQKYIFLFLYLKFINTKSLNYIDYKNILNIKNDIEPINLCINNSDCDSINNTICRFYNNSISILAYKECTCEDGYISSKYHAQVPLINELCVKSNKVNISKYPNKLNTSFSRLLKTPYWLYDNYNESIFPWKYPVLGMGFKHQPKQIFTIVAMNIFENITKYNNNDIFKIMYVNDLLTTKTKNYNNKIKRYLELPLKLKDN